MDGKTGQEPSVSELANQSVCGYIHIWLIHMNSNGVANVLIVEASQKIEWHESGIRLHPTPLQPLFHSLRVRLTVNTTFKVSEFFMTQSLSPGHSLLPPLIKISIYHPDQISHYYHKYHNSRVYVSTTRGEMN